VAMVGISAGSAGRDAILESSDGCCALLVVAGGWGWAGGTSTPRMILEVCSEYGGNVNCPPSGKGAGAAGTAVLDGRCGVGGTSWMAGVSAGFVVEPSVVAGGGGNVKEAGAAGAAGAKVGVGVGFGASVFGADSEANGVACGCVSVGKKEGGCELVEGAGAGREDCRTDGAEVVDCVGGARMLAG
jgi:hypothetical protein